MRVALLTPNARAGDAIGRGVVEKVGYFRDRGADVRVVLADDRGLNPALKPYALRQTNDDTHSAGFTALSNADLIVVEYSQYHRIFELLPLLADGSRRIVFDYHGVTPAHLAAANQRDVLMRGAEWAAIAGFADQVVVQSTFAARELAESISLPANRVHRFGLPVDSEWFSPGEPTKLLRQRLGLGNAQFLLFVGRVAKNKRLPVLISALDHLREVDPPVHVAIVGPSGECYEAERQFIRELAADLQVADRVHFLGAVDESTLRDCYRSADALVMPSVHEAFCLPVLEAMACGLPVIAARAAALPETVGDAGLTFTPDDPADLAATIRRVISSRKPEAQAKEKTKRIAIVTPAFGETVGGAERSLTLMARLLHERGYAIDVFTIADSQAVPGAIPVHVFPAEPVNHTRRAAALERCSEGDESHEPTYWQHTLRSESLIQALADSGPWSAVIVGPATNALTRDVVRRFGPRAIVMPCLHDEPASQLAGTRETFSNAGGVLFHSAEERELAFSWLGYNHPNSSIIGTVVSANPAARPANKNIAGRYVVTVGRRVAEKNLPLLFDFGRRYHTEFPDRFRFAFVGEGGLSIPNESWAVDLGRLSDDDKNAVVAGADALVNLSVNESLSLVVLEAQASSVPVILHADSPVMAGHVERGQGGRAIKDYNEFASALNELWDEPEVGRALGQAGRDYVVREFADGDRLISSVERVIENLHQPLREVMIEAGLRRAREFSRERWRSEFDRVVDQAMHQTSPGPASRVDLPSYKPAEIARATVTLGRPARNSHALQEAVKLAQLPDDYVDVTEGRFARVKRWIKAKLLHNFKASYVDVLARQQSRFNRRVLEALEEMHSKSRPRRSKRRRRAANSGNQTVDYQHREAS